MLNTEITQSNPQRSEISCAQPSGEKALKAVLLKNPVVIQLLEVVKRNAATWRELETYYTCAMMEVETKFRVLDTEFSLQYDRNPIEAIKTRLKSVESLGEKILRRGVDPSIEAIENNIFDMAGVRVICSFPEDVYMLADSFLNQDDVVLVQRKDYIKNPKENGYRALHLVVEIPIYLHKEKRMMKVEVQLRTIAMDFWASLEHKLRYKKELDGKLLDEISQELYDCAEASARLDMKMQAIRDKIEK